MDSERRYRKVWEALALEDIVVKVFSGSFFGARLPGYLTTTRRLWLGISSQRSDLHLDHITTHYSSIWVLSAVFLVCDKEGVVQHHEAHFP